MSAGTADLTRELRDFEARHALFQREIDGIPWWELSRYPVFWALAGERGLWSRSDGQRAAPVLGEGLGARAARLARSLARAPRARLPAAGAPLLVLGHPRRTRRRDGSWWDPYLDPVADHCRRLGLESVFFEAPHRGRFHYAPAHTPDLRHLDAHMSWARLRPGRRLALGSAASGELARLDAALRQELGARLSLDATVRRQLQQFCDDRSMWTRILRRLRPRAAFFVAGTGREGLVAAARAQGVTSVELQHGSPAPGKPNYDYDRSERPRRLFADYFAAYGAYWKERNTWPIDPERVWELGSPQFQLARRQLEGTRKEREIVFLSQATVGRELARFAAGVARRLPEGWRLLYKLHPEEGAGWRERSPELADARIEVVDDRGSGLHPLLARAQVQVGVYSTALYEGLGLGCRTLLVDLPGVEYMRDLVERGMATVVSEPAQLAGLCPLPRVSAEWSSLLFGDRFETRLERFLSDELGLPLPYPTGRRGT